MEDYNLLVIEKLDNILIYLENILIYLESIHKYVGYIFALIIFLIAIKFIYNLFAKIFFGGL